ncbi:MAG: 2,3-bisphosphoglycerate-independent phosphoglycerate mutase [Parcubacteria group bacterium]|nr:MAG: 2,3-bisphosphoglycerate-independent phosphoglycerate mutase [Parcubacteria group bacterium]
MPSRKTKPSSRPYCPLVLAILDGYGVSVEKKGNPEGQAKTPVMDCLNKKYVHAKLSASSRDVGLPLGQPGNSEAGHMNIGAGRVVEQDAVIISKSISNGTFYKNPAFLQAAKQVEDCQSDVHLMGLLSDGSSPHADNDHLLSLLSFFLSKTKQKIYLHLFTDGRDSPRFAALKLLSQYKTIFNNGRVRISTVMGRFYAMDRKKAWDRTKLAYNALVLGRGYYVKSGIDAVSQAYNRGESDEFIKPSVVVKNGQPIGSISENDALVFFNLRSDRARQLAKVFAQKDFETRNPGSFRRVHLPKNLLFVTLTDFGPDLDHIITAYPSIDIADTLPMALHSLRQLYIAETEKYAHVTYFFNGGYDHSIAGETRVNIPSKNVDSYDQAPAMSTREITRYVIQAITKEKYDFVTINYASPDMVGHSGNMLAAVKAIEILDRSLGELAKTILSKKGTLIITADHGNVEEMIDVKTSEVDTEHSLNPVPFILITNQKKYKLKNKGRLASIAPTILDILKISKPKLMTGQSLIKK